MQQGLCVDAFGVPEAQVTQQRAQTTLPLLTLPPLTLPPLTLPLLTLPLLDRGGAVPHTAARFRRATRSWRLLLCMRMQQQLLLLCMRLLLLLLLLLLVLFPRATTLSALMLLRISCCCGVTCRHRDADYLCRQQLGSTTRKEAGGDCE